MALIDDLIKGTTAERDLRINNAKRYLADTDWVIAKIDEYRILGKDYQELVTKYADILEKREMARLDINENE